MKTGKISISFQLQAFYFPVLNCEAGVIAVLSCAWEGVLLYLTSFFFFVLIVFCAVRSCLSFPSTYPQQVLPMSAILSWQISIKALNTWIMKCRQEHIKLPELLSLFLKLHYLTQSNNGRWQLHFDILNIYQVMWYAFEVFLYTFFQMSWLIPHSFIPTFIKLHF